MQIRAIYYCDRDGLAVVWGNSFLANCLFSHPGQKAALSKE